MSYVFVKRPTDHLVIWSLGHLTNTYDMGHWTSQHLTAGSAKYVSALSREGTTGKTVTNTGLGEDVLWIGGIGFDLLAQ
jgi:hypothetical protein